LTPLEAARAAHLRYVDDSAPGLRRLRHGKGFRYLDASGRPLRDREQLERIRRLAIPPAWTDVWICPAPDGHIQATGRDARGRKQYRYHARFREVRDETKYDRMLSFAEALPRIREAADAALRRPELTRERVLAAVVRLLEVTLIRVGNEEYARQNGSYGLTTLREDHVEVEGSVIHFHFRGKSGIEHTIDVRDRRLARIVQRCLGLPGEVLFQYVGEDGELHSVESADVNAYIRELAGADFTAKDFRTWAGTVLAAYALRGIEPAASATALKRNIAAAIKRVARRLGNTPAVCRKCYVHPAIIKSYSDGLLASALPPLEVELTAAAAYALSNNESAVLMLLQGGGAVMAQAA
jgi:DNA topoisomerase-1